MISAVFVYGTLMPGHSRWPLLAPFVIGDPVRDRITGRLLDTGHGYPALVDLDADVHVQGWAVTLDVAQLDEALDLLDGIEGTDVGLYSRVPVTTLGGRRCWTYRWEHDVGGMVDLRGIWDAG